MKKVLLIFIGLYALSAVGQNSRDETSQITVGVEALYKAMVSKDKATLEKLTLDKLTYGHSSGTLENKNQYVEAVMNGPFDFISITPVDQSIEISNDTAVVRHYFDAKGTDNGKAVDVHIGVMMVWQKNEGDWRLLARQAYKL